jgi:hypothetical protein
LHPFLIKFRFASASAMGAFSLFRNGSASKHPKMTRISKIDSHDSDAGSTVDESEQPESEVQWLRRMFDKEKAEKEWIMARYEVAEFYLKAKDAEILRLRNELSKGCVPASPVYIQFGKSDAKTFTSSIEADKLKKEQSSPGLRDRRNVHLSLVGCGAGKPTVTRSLVAEDTEQWPSHGFVQTLPGEPLPVAAAPQPSPMSVGLSKPSLAFQTNVREPSSLLQRRPSASAAFVAPKPIPEQQVDMFDDSGLSPRCEVSASRGTPIDLKNSAVKKRSNSVVARRLGSVETSNRRMSHAGNLTLDVTKSHCMSSPQSPKRSRKRASWPQ